MVAAVLQHVWKQIVKNTGTQQGRGVEIELWGFRCRCLNVLQRGPQRFGASRLAGTVSDRYGEEATVDENADLPVRLI